MLEFKMPQSLAQIYIHLVFSTKERTPMIAAEHESRLFAYLVKVADYIRYQAEHHKTHTFQSEFRRLLEKYGVSYDEAYVWD
jgi:tRNA C32,U32 (ribose-2'-O)-methylase TrmJ